MYGGAFPRFFDKIIWRLMQFRESDIIWGVEMDEVNASCSPSMDCTYRYVSRLK